MALARPLTSVQTGQPVGATLTGRSAGRQPPKPKEYSG